MLAFILMAFTAMPAGVGKTQFSMALVSAVVEGTGTAGMLDPRAIKVPGPDLYFTLKRQSAADLTHCLMTPA